MSQESAHDGNAETVRRFMESWTRRDLDGVLACADPRMEFDWSRSRSPQQGIYRGHDGLVQLWADQEDAWEQFSIEVIETIPIDRERLVAVTRVRGRGRGSGIDLEAGGAMLWSVRGGLIQSGKLFQDKDGALEAAGMAEGP
jgi:ketosteroid isomerase-like protein